MIDRLAYFIATAGFVGRFPVAPGTAGSVAVLVVYALIRAASNGWSEQIGFLRGQAQGLDERIRSDHQELHAAVERLQDEVARLGGYAFQTQVQERMINRVEEEHARLAESISEVAQELALVIERFDNRLSAMQAELNRQRSRVGEMTVAVAVGAIGVIIGLAIAIAPRFF